MPLHMFLDPNDTTTGFTYTTDSEIVTMYENGLAMPAIVKAVMWQDRVKKTVARQRVSAAIMQSLTTGVRILPAEGYQLPFATDRGCHNVKTD